jgi:hypothetical protein
MRRLANEIDDACDTKKIDCNPKPPSVMPSQIYNYNSFFQGIFDNFVKSLYLVINYGGADWVHYKADRDVVKLISMRAKLKTLLLDPIDPPIYTKGIANKNESLKKIIHRGNYGYIDSVTHSLGILKVQGWAILPDGKKFSSVDIYLNNEKRCSILTSIDRPDISKLYPENIGFSCLFPLEVNKYSTFHIKAFANLNLDNKNTFLLNNTDLVDITMSNKFNESCYLKHNPDVSNAVKEGIITALDHWESSGMRENRVCTPLYNAYTDYDNYRTKLINYGYVKDGVVQNSFKSILIAYRYLILFSTFLIVPLFFIMLRKKEYFNLTILSTFIILALTRIGMVSILSYLAIVPISPLYLMSGIFSLFIACLVTFIFTIYYFINFINFIKKYEFRI